MVSVIILYDKEGKMLLEHRTETRKNYPGCWGLFGGRAEKGETPEQTVRREIKEELNYDLSHPVLLYTQHLEHGSEKHVYVEAYDESQAITLQPRESQGYAWLTLEEYKKLSPTISHDTEPLEKAWEYIQKQSGRGQ